LIVHHRIAHFVSHQSEAVPDRAGIADQAEGFGKSAPKSRSNSVRPNVTPKKAPMAFDPQSKSEENEV
jgi:hypothetical protein